MSIVAAYGESFDSDAYRAAIHAYCQQQDHTFYLPVTIEDNAYATPEDTLFTVIQQLINALIDAMPAHEQAPLLNVFRTLWNVQKKVKEYAPEDQRAEFMQFCEFSCFPVLRDLFKSEERTLAFVFYHFEHVCRWAGVLYNFLLDPLIDNFTHIPLRIVVFVNSDEKPGFFYGSNEESDRQAVCFYRLA